MKCSGRQRERQIRFMYLNTFFQMVRNFESVTKQNVTILIYCKLIRHDNDQKLTRIGSDKSKRHCHKLGTVTYVTNSLLKIWPKYNVTTPSTRHMLIRHKLKLERWPPSFDSVLTNPVTNPSLCDVTHTSKRTNVTSCAMPISLCPWMIYILRPV